MFVLFLFLGLKLHSNYNLRTQEKNGGNQEMENQWNSNINKFTSKKKEGGKYKCEVIKFNGEKIKDSSEKRVLFETDSDYEAFLRCDNTNYNPNQNNVEIEGTVMNGVGKHINDQNSDALIIIKNADFRCSSSLFRSSSSANKDAQVIHFLGEGIHTLTNTDFKWCGKNPYINQKNNENLLEDFDPTLIVFDDSSKNFISGGQFYHSSNESPQSFEVHPVRCIRTKKACSLVVSGTYFYNATAYHKGSFFLLDSNDKASIMHSYFEACYDRENYAHAICANQGMVDINDCEFNNVLANTSSHGSIIRANTKTLNFEGNNIKFDNPSINCHYLYIPNSGSYNILQNEFKNIKIDQNSSVIYTDKPSDISFNYNEFDHLMGTKSGHALLLTFDTLEDNVLVGNKFRNIPSGDGLIYIRSYDEIESNYTFDNWDFKNIHQNGGGIINVDNSNNNKYGLILNNCYFENNNNTDGGCLLVNSNTFPKCILVVLENCQCHFNKASGKGGVIAIFVDADLIINDGDFNVNSAQEGGGVIYIEPERGSQRKCLLTDVQFNRNYGANAHCIWINVLSNALELDNFTLEIQRTHFDDSNGHYDFRCEYGASCLTNCRTVKVTKSSFEAKNIQDCCGGINVTAKCILEVTDTQFTKCNAGSTQGSYGGGIGYNYMSDTTRTEKIEIQKCTFDGGVGKNGVAISLSMKDLDVSISDVDVKNHVNSEYIFCIFFYREADDFEFTLNKVNFIGNSYNSKLHNDDCGGAGIWIAEAKPQDYLRSLTVKFVECHFEYNYSPSNGGAFGYDTSERLKSVELVFDRCYFKHNKCGGSGGACHFATKKTVEMYNCEFTNNTCGGGNNAIESVGGALEFYSTVESATIYKCEFSNCKATKGSFISTTGGIKGFNISKCSFLNLDNEQFSSVHIDVDSSARTFIFEYNDFIDLSCQGTYGGSGLHIGTGRDCEITHCKFEGNKGKDTENIDEAQIRVPEKSNHKLIFNNCEFKQGTKGSRAIYINDESPIEFFSCNFTNFRLEKNKATEAGRGVLVFSKSEEKTPIFDNCIFTNVSCLSALQFANCKVIQIENCNFTSVEAYIENLNSPGGLLYINKATHFSLINCSLDSCGSPDRYKKSCFELCSSIVDAEVINCSFINCGRCPYGAAVYAENVTNIIIQNSTFFRNMALGDPNDTLSVYVGSQTKRCEISFCTIHTRQARSKNEIYQIRIKSESAIFINNIFDKVDYGNEKENEGFGGVYFADSIYLNLSSNIFETRNRAVYITNVEQIDIINNTWQNCQGDNSVTPHVIYVKTRGDSLTFSNNTVKDCVRSQKEVKLMTFSAKNIIIENCNFLTNNLTYNKGGIGMSFEDTGFNAQFINCLFEGNTAGESLGKEAAAGVIYFDKDGSLEFNSCTFKGNKVPGKGGALVFTSQKNHTIQECTFIENSADTGGAIYIDSPTTDLNDKDSTKIISCQFEKNVAKNGGSILINSGKSIIEGCQIISENSGAGGMITCQGHQGRQGHMEVTNTSFGVSDPGDNGYSGINIESSGTSVIHDCIFNNLITSKKGNAINLLNSGVENEIYHNTFNNCGKSNYVIYCTGVGINFYDNQINFDEVSKSCGCIEITYSGGAELKHWIHDNHFHDCTTNNGNLHYKCNGNDQSELIVENNIFENLYGYFAAFWIETVKNINTIFNNNSIQNNQPGNYLCGFNLQGTYNKQTKFTITNNKFINNTCGSQFGGGIGLWIQNKPSAGASLNHMFTFQFENCLFEGNYATINSGTNSIGKGGAVQIGISLTLVTVSPAFVNCSFKSNKADDEGGALSISVIGVVTIQDCTFTDNLAGLNPTNQNTTAFGGAVHFDRNYADGSFKQSSERHEIQNSSFTGNSAPGATAILIDEFDDTTNILIHGNCQFIDNGKFVNGDITDVIVSSAKKFSILDSSFKFSNPSSKSPRAIKILKQATIKNTFFSNVNGNYGENQGTAVYIPDEAGPITIDDCIFSDCGNNCGSNNAAIFIGSGESIQISNSKFNFSNSDTASGGIRAIKSGTISILNNYFTKTKSTDASLYYNTAQSTNKNKENTRIEGNIFDNSHPGSKAVYLEFVTDNVVFYNNTIQNINAGYILQCQPSTDVNNFDISHCTFRNLTSNAQFGGGAGLWVQKGKASYSFNFNIIECTFENSWAKYSGSHTDSKSTNGYGGGLQFGVTNSESVIITQIRDCTFKGNKADRCGGGLSIGLKNSFTIDNCIFESNIGGLEDNEYYGGALFIDYRNPDAIPESIAILHCTFKNNTAPDGNAIFITNLPNTQISIQENTVFEDNCNEGTQTDRSAVIIDSQSLIIDSCKFTHKNVSQSSRALEAGSVTTKVSSTLFNNCTCNIHRRPNAIWIKEQVISCHIELCEFIDNGNGNGNVIQTETRDFLFEDSTIKFNTYDRTARGMYVPYPCKFYVMNSSFIHCHLDADGPSSCAGIHYKNLGTIKLGYNEEIRIEKSTFDSNVGGHTSHLLLDEIKTFPTLDNLTFKGSIIKQKFTLVIFFGFVPQEEFCIQNIIFENNSFNKFDGGGSGIWIAEKNVKQGSKVNTWPLTFNKCIFKKNHASYSGGAVSYGESPTLSFISLNFNECHFIENECEGKTDDKQPDNQGGGALWINSQEIVNISNCVFTDNKALGTSTRAASPQGKGHAIYAAPMSLITVENCKFIDNGAVSDGSVSVIQISAQQFNLTRSEISFTNVQNACRGIYIDFPGTVNIRSTKFTNCNSKGREGGGIYYKNSNTDSVLEEQITIEGCTFDNCRAGNGCAMLFWATVPPNLIGNKVINQKTGAFVISIFYTSFQDYSVVENMEFIGGVGADEDGGGSSIWIANNKEISNGRPSELIFRNCRWEDNQGPRKGGAFHYGNSQTLIGTELTFEDCKFINNRAKDAGGAVSIATISPSVFRNCEFNGNIVERSTSSSTKGSAIYVDSETPLCLISGCTFTNSSADEGNAIYASTKVLALHVTDNTRISNCGSSGSCIEIQSKEFFFLNSRITFDSINKAARGICIKTLCVVKISDSIFTKCSLPADKVASNQDYQGGAIFINNLIETDSQEEIQLICNTFDACRASNGCAVMLWIQTNPTIRGNVITNHNYNKYILTIIRKTNFADQFTIENCSFVKNKFSNKRKEDGGGAAIWIANQEFFNEGEYTQLIFKDCNWTKNTGVYGGAFSYGTSNTVKYIQLEFQNCHFENNQASGPQGGALHITTEVPSTISGCTFYNNKCVNNIQNLGGGDQALGGAIYFDTNAPRVDILNTTFRKNSAQSGNALFVSQKTQYIEIVDAHFLSNSNGNVGAQVAHQGVEFRATNTNFDYQVVTLHSKGVDILSKSRTSFVDCNFTLCETPYDKGGALFVQDQLNSENVELLTLEGCIFDNCNSSEGSSIYASLSTLPSIKRCTVKNNNQGCSIFVFKFTDTQVQMDIENCTFQNNEFLNTENKPDCGGSGIWISNVNKIHFEKCYFINNKADYVGGALAYGHDNELANIFLEFEECYFEENVCNGKYGGALYLVNTKDTIIKGCTFRQNRPLAASGLKGGDIYIDCKSSVNIANSIFESTTSQMIEEGNAIYCSSNTNLLSVSETNFNNCGTQGTVVVSYAKEIKFSDSHLIFDQAVNERSARGLAFYLTSSSISTKIEHCTFVNCYFSSQDSNVGGGGIYIKYTDQGPSSSELLLDDCSFEGTLANSGAVMYLDICSPPTLKSIKAIKCRGSNNIILIKYTNSVENTEFESCTFEENQLTSSNDGGGSGISISLTQKITFSGCTFKNNTAAGNGGAFACYNTQEAKNTELEFNGCTFYGNNAQSNGGALYLVTNKPISINGGTFDSNVANGNSGALYIDSKSNIKIESVNIVRNKASSKNAALYINNAQTLDFNHNTISDNLCPSSPSSTEINNEGTANLVDNKFNFARQSNSQYQISLTGSSSSAVCNFKLNCFTHKGDITNNNLVHILSNHQGQINMPAGNCFDSGQYNSLQHNGGPSSVGENIFNCNQCGDIYVPTAAPISTPTATRQMTSKPTEIPLPTDKPHTPTQGTSSSSGESDIVSSSTSSSNNNNVDSNKGKKKKSATIGMIAGITAAIVVVIVVVIILLWLFIFRRRRNNNSPQGGVESNIPSTNDETVSGVNTTPQDDPIWAGATATHDNPLFNGSDDQDDDQMMHTGFEESWGENVI